MPMTALTGSRVRERRLLLGMRQGELAEAAGISASYLNLIEHNRRRVAGEVLLRLAAALDVKPDILAEGAEGVLVADLRDAAAGAAAPIPEVDRIEDFIGRFPGWAALLSAQHRRLGTLERSVAALSDRMAHDPHLSAALHELLSALSSVRSTAAILAESEDIEPDWRARFHANLHADSERLAVGAETLVAYLDSAGEAEEAGIAAPQEELEAWLSARDWQVPELEQGGAGLARLQDEAGQLPSSVARALATDWLRIAAEDAARLPMERFKAAIGAGLPDPGQLAQRFGTDIVAVFRRLALVPGARWGVVGCDASGTLTFRRPVEGFPLPRFAAACPLWPLYRALGRPMTPISALVEMASRRTWRFRALAFAAPRLTGGFGGPEVVEAAMLLMPVEATAEPALPVGTTCRICPRSGCAARREASLMDEGRSE